MENKNLKYFAAACYALLAVFAVVDVINYFSVINLISVVAYILIAVALMIGIHILSTVGFVVHALCGLYAFVQLYKVVKLGYFDFYQTVPNLMFVVVCVSLVIASIQPKSAKNLGLVAAIITAIRLIYIVIEYAFVFGGVGLSSYASVFFTSVLTAAGAILLGLNYDYISRREETVQSNTVQTRNAPSQETYGESNVEKIMRLKSMLDAGVITQEEFDAKKKQLLGL